MSPLQQAAERLTRANKFLARTKQDLYEAIEECQNLKMKVKGAPEGQRAQLRKEIAEAEVEVAKAEVEVAKAEVEAAKAKLKGAPDEQRAWFRTEITEAEEDLVKVRANLVDASGQ
jgi:chromosome segregation ATPase